MKWSYLKYIVSLLLFGSNGVVASFIHLNSYKIVLMRTVLGSVFLTAIFLSSRQKLAARQYKKDLLFIAVSGAAMAADWLLLFEAYQEIGVSLGMLINYCGPVIVIAFSPVLFKEKITWKKLTALGIALVGIFLISGQAASEGISGWGLLCAGLSAGAYAAMVIFNKLAKQITGVENATFQLLFALVIVAIFVACKQGLFFEVTADDWIPVLILGLVNTGLGCFLYFSSIGELPTQTVAICGYLEPLSAVLFATVFLHETMEPVQLAGAAMIIGGTLLGEYEKLHK